MSDPRKNFICKARKHIVNDTQRLFGKHSDCELCFYDSIKNRKPTVNMVNFYEPLEEIK